MNKIILYLKRRFFCKHKMKFVENTEWYFHFQCEKCGYETGGGNFKLK